MKLLGHSPVPIHPKHLYDNRRTVLLEQYLKTDHPGYFLDLGSARGTDVIRAADYGWKSTGLEYSQKLVDYSLNLSERYDNTTFVVCNLENPPFPFSSNTFDLIQFTNVLEHLNNRSSVLNEVRRLLTEDGVCIISIPNSNTLWKKLQRFVGLSSFDDPDHKVEYTESEIYDEITASGLEVASPLYPTVPSFPFHGILASSAVISPRLYRLSQSLKYWLCRSSLFDTVGWIFLVRKSS